MSKNPCCKSEGCTEYTLPGHDYCEWCEHDLMYQHSITPGKGNFFDRLNEWVFCDSKTGLIRILVFIVVLGGIVTGIQISMHFGWIKP